VTTTVVSPLPAELVPQLASLYRREWWTKRRTGDDIARMLAGPSITFALVEDETNELVRFTRVLCDGAYVALVLDVIVRSDQRGKTYGRLLLDTVLDDARVRSVRSVELVCQPGLVDFNKRFGFTDAVGRSRLMRRTEDPLLTGGHG
jgi:hypothetical protein